jgi:2-polyprenyl-3-methyl-5-hydroxy-6-metoxy-1,4-benzoquinol methylase
LKERSKELELLDLGPDYYTTDEYEGCLHQLDRVGKILGGHRVGLKLFDQLKLTPTSILDIGCGGGQFCHILAKKYPNTSILGIDLNPNAIAFAKKNKPQELNSVHYKLQNDKTLPFEENSFDVVTATLVCHHMEEEELSVFLKHCYQVAKHAVILNDLHRHWIPHAVFSLIAPPLFSNRLIFHDGLASIRRGFKKRDLKKLIPFPSDQVKIHWYFPFRWGVIIDK